MGAQAVSIPVPEVVVPLLLVGKADRAQGAIRVLVCPVAEGGPTNADPVRDGAAVEVEREVEVAEVLRARARAFRSPGPLEIEPHDFSARRQQAVPEMEVAVNESRFVEFCDGLSQPDQRCPPMGTAPGEGFDEGGAFGALHDHEYPSVGQAAVCQGAGYAEFAVVESRKGAPLVACGVPADEPLRLGRESNRFFKYLDDARDASLVRRESDDLAVVALKNDRFGRSFLQPAFDFGRIVQAAHGCVLA